MVSFPAFLPYLLKFDLLERNLDNSITNTGFGHNLPTDLLTIHQHFLKTIQVSYTFLSLKMGTEEILTKYSQMDCLSNSEFAINLRLHEDI